MLAHSGNRASQDVMPLASTLVRLRRHALGCLSISVESVQDGVLIAPRVCANSLKLLVWKFERYLERLVKAPKCHAMLCLVVGAHSIQEYKLRALARRKLDVQPRQD